MNVVKLLEISEKVNKIKKQRELEQSRLNYAIT